METSCREHGQDKLVNLLYDLCARHDVVLLNGGKVSCIHKFGTGWDWVASFTSQTALSFPVHTALGAVLT
jgi:hypothetical protein